MQHIHDFAILQKEEGKFVKDIRTFDVKRAVFDVIKLLNDSVEQKEIQVVSFFLDFPVILINDVLQESFQIKSDEQRLQQVMFTLLSNAIQFSERKGKV